MEIAKRVETYKAIEEKRGRPLIVYATSTRRHVEAQMGGDAVREFVDQIEAVRDHDKVDVLIHSFGGDALVAWKLISMLRESFSHISALVPNMAYSAATLFCMGADEIVLHPYANLGPIDPQIHAKDKNGQPLRFAYEDVGAFLRFLSEDAGITEQRYTPEIVNRLFESVEPFMIGGAKRASDLASTVGERLLRTHMTAPEDALKAREIAEELNKNFLSHGDAVSRSRARELGLKIADDDPELEDLIWKAYLGLEEHMSLRSQWDPLVLLLQDEEIVEAIRIPAPVKLPPNAPQQVAQPVWQQAGNQALAKLGSSLKEVEHTLIIAVIESPRIAFEYGQTQAWSVLRDPMGKLVVNSYPVAIGWKPISLPS